MMNCFPSTKPYEIIIGVPFVFTTVCSMPLCSRFLIPASQQMMKLSRK